MHLNLTVHTSQPYLLTLKLIYFIDNIFLICAFPDSGLLFPPVLYVGRLSYSIYRIFVDYKVFLLSLLSCQWGLEYTVSNAEEG